MHGGHAFRLAGGGSFYLRPSDTKDLKDEYSGIDVDDVVSDCAKRARNLRLIDGKAVVLFIRNELSLARTKAARLASEALEKRARIAWKAEPPQVVEAPVEERLAPPKQPIMEKPMNDPAKPRREPAAVELFRSKRDGVQKVMIQTSAQTIDSFVVALSSALTEAIHNEPEDVDGLVLGVMRSAVPLSIKIAGYRVDSVKEERILISGYVHPDESSVIGQGE
jgi:hypothetical protein